MSDPTLLQFWARYVVSFHLANDPRLAQTLRTELATVMPTDASPVELARLEALLYLTGAVPEENNPKISITVVDMIHDENIIPQWFEFQPERWLDQPNHNDNSIDKYSVVFGKCARSCLGMILASSLLYQTLGKSPGGTTSIDSKHMYWT